MIFGTKNLTLKQTHDFCATKEPKINLVFLHGIASSSTSFHNTLKYLENTPSLKSARFITYDWLGSGKSKTSDKLAYNFDEQLSALKNSLKKLKPTVPTIFIAHSMGTILASRYAELNKKSVKNLILISAPAFTKTELDSDLFKQGMELFFEKVKQKDSKILKSRAFNNSMQNIVFDHKTYQIYENLKTHTTFIYGTKDQLISGPNLEKLAKTNPKYLKTISVEGGHSLSNEKYAKLLSVLEEILSHETL